MKEAWISGVLLLIFTLFWKQNEAFKIGAFNIQIFGIAKAGKPDVMATLTKIVRRYDIVLIQEIRDSSGTAILSLLNDVNAGGDYTYAMTISERLGRTISKEQYAFLYREINDISVVGELQYTDTNDFFEREPFMVRFSVGNTGVTLMGIHVSPNDAVEEIGNLTVVHAAAVQRWDDNIIIMGDLNADCSYVANYRWDSIPLRTDQKYYWPIADDADTTVATSACAYDRFVITGTSLINSVDIPATGLVFRFDTEYQLTQAETEDVSDHYPIELDFTPQIESATTIAVSATTAENNTRSTCRVNLSLALYTIICYIYIF